MKVTHVVAGLALFGAGFLSASSGLVGRLIAPAQADVAVGPQREAFKAGSERSEATLKEIADTLKKMDARLEKIEEVATKK